MNAEIKQKWVEALRSGKYEQGHTQLRYDNRYCCLGVLCDVSGLGEWDNDNGYVKSAAENLPKDRGFCFLPDFLGEPLGIKDKITLHVTYKDERVSLNDLNDGTNINDMRVKLSFPEIADLIEQQL